MRHRLAGAALIVLATLPAGSAAVQVDPGAVACTNILNALEHNGLAGDRPDRARLMASANADLRAAGIELDRLAIAHPPSDPDVPADELDELQTALDQLVMGCAAMGVTLPPGWADITE